MLTRLFSAIEARLERRRRYRSALEYNFRNTFSLSDNASAGTWLCPSCCRVHYSHSTSKFSGPQFEACCEHPAGGRIGKQFATGR